MTDNPLSPDDPRGNLPPGMRGVPGAAQSKGKARQTVFLKKPKTSEKRSSDESIGAIPVKAELFSS